LRLHDTVLVDHGVVSIRRRTSNRAASEE